MSVEPESVPSSVARDAHRERGAVGGARLVVPDVLRGTALLAMLIAHAAPFLPDLPAWMLFVSGNINDLASPLFALVMGMSAQLVVQRTATDRRFVMLVQQFTRGAVLILLGLILTEWGSWVAVVLSYLGLLLIVGAPILLLSTRWVAAIAIAMAVLSQPINDGSRQWLMWVFSDPTGFLPQLAMWTSVGGSYRLTNLLPFFLLGALLLRHGLRRDGLLWMLLAIAPLAYAVQPVVQGVFGVEVIASGSYVDTLHDLGLVLVTYVGVVLLAEVRAAGARRVIDAVFVPLRALGALALSIYVLHVGVLALIGGRVFPDENHVWEWLVIVPGMVLVAWLWWRFVGTGPIEWGMGWLTGRPKPRPGAAR
ncbi:heparan-alpha-glucosaminide N-acetyltransferase domain-containing protein [Microbacterium hominis]|uniref:DUF1624 domain-containing protein n=1 Tax=Microbacterium hominis TaxID=162426 RepID=A0A7D4TPE3_9MICO|nr:heparan-alpha-glucosaminide N-acetyltransferase domain-containing protein [Microbacterium hominis]QKJ20302.1 DUF1624 domain-containing protein [Microbacterium hominis]